jgi:hypothetical protein
LPAELTKAEILDATLDVWVRYAHLLIQKLTSTGVDVAKVLAKEELKGVWIDPKLHRAVKTKAAREGRKIREIVEDAIKASVGPKKRGAA